MRIKRLTLGLFAAALPLAMAVAAAAAAAAAAAEPSFVPVIKDNFPDAAIIQHDGQFYAYATNDGANLPVAVSRNLSDWTILTDPANPTKRFDAMPRLASWAKEGFTWAPEVFELGGKYLLYYTASSRRQGAQCVGVAIADHPKGPFRDAASEPLLCQTALGADGRTLIGAPVRLLGDKEKWKARVIEAPTMVRSPAGAYQLFFSGGFFGWNPEEGGLSPYAMGYATCSGPLGPCADAPQNPILHSFKEREAGCLSGPGHQSLFTVGARSFISFHAWAATARCTKLEDERYLYIAPIFWKDGKPVLGPSLRPTPAK